MPLASGLRLSSHYRLSIHSTKTITDDAWRFVRPRLLVVVGGNTGGSGEAPPTGAALFKIVWSKHAKSAAHLASGDGTDGAYLQVGAESYDPSMVFAHLVARTVAQLDIPRPMRESTNNGQLPSIVSSTISHSRKYFYTTSTDHKD